MPIGAPVQTGTPPAKRATPKKSGAASSQPAVTQSQARYEGLLGVGQIGSAICVMRGLFADAGAITLHWPNVSRETVQLAAQNEQIGKAVDYLISAGPYTGLLLAALPLGLQIAANHGRVDVDQVSGISGVMPPAALEAKVKAEAQQLKARLMREAQDAQAESDRLTREMAAQSQNGAAE